MLEPNGPGEAPLLTARLGVTKPPQLHFDYEQVMLPHAAGPRPGEFGKARGCERSETDVAGAHGCHSVFGGDMCGAICAVEALVARTEWWSIGGRGRRAI